MFIANVINNLSDSDETSGRKDKKGNKPNNIKKGNKLNKNMKENRSNNAKKEKGTKKGDGKKGDSKKDGKTPGPGDCCSPCPPCSAPPSPPPFEYQPESLTFQIFGDGVLPHATITTPLTRTCKDVIVLAFRSLMMGSAQTLPIIVTNTGPVPCTVGSWFYLSDSLFFNLPKL